MDLETREKVETDLERLITRRDKERRVTEGERAEEAFWAPSVRAYKARQEAENRQAWASYHTGQAKRHRRTLEELIARHEQAAAELLEHEPEGETA